MMLCSRAKHLWESERLVAGHTNTLVVRRFGCLGQSEQSEQVPGALASVHEPKAARQKTDVGIFDDDWDESPLELAVGESKRPAVTTDPATCEILRRNKEALEELRKGQAFVIDEDDDVVEIEDDAEDINTSGAQPLKVVLRTQDWQEQFAIPKNAPLKDLIETFRASAKGKLVEASLGRPPKFCFDGDVLKDHETPGDLDMEDGDVIDVR